VAVAATAAAVAARWLGGGFKADWLAWQKLPKSEARYVQHANTRLEIIFVINCTS